MVTRAHQPQLQRRLGSVGVAPGRAVVPRHSVRQPVVLKHADQQLLHGPAPFIGAGCQTQGKTGVVVQQGQWMAAATAEGKVALEIHLPESVRRLMFEPARGRNARCRARQQAVAGHHVMDGAEGGHTVSLVFEPALNLAGPPAFMAGMRHAQKVSDIV